MEPQTSGDQDQKCGENLGALGDAGKATFSLPLPFSHLINASLCQVTTLVSSKSPQKKKGKSKRAHVLVAAVEKATANFVDRGKQIAHENPDIQHEMEAAVEEVQNTGEAMSSAAREFASDPCSSNRRGNMVRNYSVSPTLSIFLLLFTPPRFGKGRVKVVCAPLSLHTKRER